MKQKEYDQWNDPQLFFSDDYFLPKKGMAILHEYLVECYQKHSNQINTPWWYKEKRPWLTDSQS